MAERNDLQVLAKFPSNCARMIWQLSGFLAAPNAAVQDRQMVVHKVHQAAGTHQHCSVILQN